MTEEEFTKLYNDSPSLQKWYSILGGEKCFLCKNKTQERLFHLKSTHGLDKEVLWAMCTTFEATNTL